MLKLYNAFVFPYLTYCVEVWGTAPKKYLDPLIKIQKKIVRIITFSPYLCHTDPIFKDLNLLPISKLVTQRIGLLMFKYSIHSLPIVIEDLFTSNTSVSNHNRKTLLNYCRSTLFVVFVHRFGDIIMYLYLCHFYPFVIITLRFV